MKRVPKPLEALVAVAKRQDASLDDIMSAAKATDQRVLKENAHFVLTSIPGTNDTGLGAIKFIAIHRAIGSEPVIFAMIAATLTRGPMVDREACIALEYMLKEACMPLVSGPFFNALAFGKSACAKLLHAHDLDKPSGGWGTTWGYIDRDKRLQVVKMLIEIANPSRDVLMQIRTIAEDASDVAIWLDAHLGLTIPMSNSTAKH